jgi:hypothetical protein
MDPAMGEDIDFFISYTHADESWAEWIAWQLEEAKYRVWLQKWDIRPGANFVLHMQEGARAERTIAVLSPAYLESGFTAAEWAAAFAEDPQGTDGKLLLVRVADCKPPGLLRAVVYIDLFEKSRDDARAALLEGVRPGRAKPEREPAFPGEGAPAGHRAAREPAFPTDLVALYELLGKLTGGQLDAVILRAGLPRHQIRSDVAQRASDIVAIAEQGGSAMVSRIRAAIVREAPWLNVGNA